jgi:hypothetical protein
MPRSKKLLAFELESCVGGGVRLPATAAPPFLLYLPYHEV